MLLKMIFAFLVGGALCAVAQVMIDKTSLTPAKILVIFVCLGVLLGGVGLYDPIFNFAGCGISLPIVGFGGAVAKGVKEAVDEKGILGAFLGGFKASAAGISGALIFGYLASLVFKPKMKD